MIRYALRCPDDHAFESWFQSVEAFDTLCNAGHVACPVCDSRAIVKSLMSPAVRLTPKTGPEAEETPQRALSTPANPREEALAALRRQVEANSDYVGSSFAMEARAIHDGTSVARSIHGEAKPDEARKLIEEGVPILPLPFMPIRKTN